MSFDILRIWMYSNVEIQQIYTQLITKGYTVKTESPNIHVKVMSCFLGAKTPFFSETQSQIIANPKFLRELERLSSEGCDHIDTLIIALQNIARNEHFDRIESLNVEIQKRAQEEERIEAEKKLKIAQKEYQDKLVKAGDVLERTRSRSIADICPFNPQSDDSFFAFNPNTQKLELLDPVKVFQHNGQCFDIDAIYRYISHGGVVALDADYIRRFFRKNGAIDFDDMNITSDRLINEETYHEGTHSISLKNNRITTLFGVTFPSTVTGLFLSNNPIHNNYDLRRCGAKLKIVDLSQCGISGEFDMSKLPDSVVNLSLKGNRDLEVVLHLKECKHIRQLDISDTGITTFNCNSLPNHKITIIASPGVKFLHKNNNVTIRQ